MEQTFTIKQVAEITRLNGHTLRYYERIGLLHPVGRTKNGYRSYTTVDIEWIEFLTRLRATGMPIRTMLKYSELRRKGDGTVKQRRELLEEHEVAIRARIAELTQHLTEITTKIVVYKQMEGNHGTEH